MKKHLLHVIFLILLCIIMVACGGGNGSSNNGNGGNGPGAQTWIIDAGPDPVQQGREEQATVVIQPFTYSGTFNEVSPDPLGGMLVYNGDGSCSYQVVVNGSVANGSNSIDWQISGSTGNGCGMSTVASGSMTGIGTFPTATSASGNITFSTQSPLGSAVDSGTWNAYLRSGGSQIVMRNRAEQQLHEPKVLYDIFRAFQPLDYQR